MAKREFKGVWIPAEIWLNKELSLLEKNFLAEIDSLDGLEGCYASNAYFAEFFDLSKDRVSDIVSSLKKKGFVSVSFSYKVGTKEIEKRIIKVLTLSAKVPIPVGENAYTLSAKVPIPVVENAEDITQYITKGISSLSTAEKMPSISEKEKLPLTGAAAERLSVIGWIEMCDAWALKESESIRMYKELARFEGDVKDEILKFCSHYFKERNFQDNTAALKFFTGGFLKWLQDANYMKPQASRAKAPAQNTKNIDASKYAQYE